MSSASIQFKCVKCGQVILVNRPQQPSAVACPKCELTFAVMPDGEIIRQDRESAFDNLPPTVVANYAPPRAKGFQATPIPAPEVVPPPTETGQYFPPLNPPVHGKSSSSRGLKTALTILGLCAALCCAVLIAGVAWYYGRDARPSEAITRMMASLDRPEQLMNDLVQHGAEIMKNVKDLESDQALDRAAMHARTAANFDRISRECDSIFNRAKYIEPLSQSSWDYQVDNLRSVLGQNSDNETLGTVLLGIQGTSPELAQSWVSLKRNYLKAVNRVMLLAMPLPEGSDLKSVTARQAAEIERHLYVQACKAESDPERSPDQFLVELEKPLAEATLAYHKLADQLAGRLKGEESISRMDKLFFQIRRYDYRGLISNPLVPRTEIEKALAEARAEVLETHWDPISLPLLGD